MWFLVGVAGAHYLVATAIVTEAAVLHNFAWHRLWTWRDRTTTPRGWLVRLGRFHLANGAVSLAGNVAVMAALTGVLGVPCVPASVMAILVCATVNFLAGDRWVFKAESVAGPVSPTFIRLPTTGRHPRSEPAGR